MSENQTLEQKIESKKLELEELKTKREELEKESSELEEQLINLKKDLKTILFWDISWLSLTEIEEKKKEVNDFIEKHFEKWEELKNSWIIDEIIKEINEESIS